MTYSLIQTSDRGERRHDHRFARSLRLVIEGQLAESGDWGFGGFRSGPIASLKLDDEFMISHILDADNAPIAVFATAKVVRRDPETGDIGVAFVHLGERAFTMLEQAMFRRRRLMAS